MKGLTPTEFYFHAMGGREGLIDTAVKTSETGYIQRKLIKGMEDARIASDYTVRNANGNILQFLYGEDGFDGAKIEKQKLLIMGKSDKELYEEYMLTIDDSIHKYYIPEVAEDIIRNRKSITAKLTENVQNILSDRDYYFNNVFKGESKSDIYSPINLKRLAENAVSTFKNIDKSDLHPEYVIKSITELEAKLTITDKYKGNEVLVVLMRTYLNPKVLACKYKLTRIAFDWIISSITQMFYNSIVHIGDLVGTIAAQSIGEPSTQMTLNTFHFAGVASKAT